MGFSFLENASVSITKWKLVHRLFIPPLPSSGGLRCSLIDSKAYFGNQFLCCRSKQNLFDILLIAS